MVIEVERLAGFLNGTLSPECEEFSMSIALLMFYQYVFVPIAAAGSKLWLT